MTTPGRRAGPTAADGDLGPRTGSHPGDGIPAAEADYGLDTDRARPEPGRRSPGRTRPRHAADTARDDERTAGAALNARIARTIQNAKSARDAGTGWAPTRAGTPPAAGPGPGGRPAPSPRPPARPAPA